MRTALSMQLRIATATDVSAAFAASLVLLDSRNDSLLEMIPINLDDDSLTQSSVMLALFLGLNNSVSYSINLLC